MTASKEKITLILKEFPKYEILEEVKEKLEKEIGPIIIKKEPVEAIDKKREEKRWKQTLGYYLLNPHKFKFGNRDLK
ncbi:MAG: hypothetical protein ACFE75_12885 [Candidatus Hodarchaeota archaeon]